jgi:hypothetical protein
MWRRHGIRGMVRIHCRGCGDGMEYTKFLGLQIQVQISTTDRNDNVEINQIILLRDSKGEGKLPR